MSVSDLDSRIAGTSARAFRNATLLRTRFAEKRFDSYGDILDILNGFYHPGIPQVKLTAVSPMEAASQIKRVLPEMYNALMYHTVYLHQMKYYELVWGGYVDGSSRSRQTFEKEYTALEQGSIASLLCQLKIRMDKEGVSVTQQQIDAVKAIQINYPSRAFSADVEEYAYLNVLINDFLPFVMTVFEVLQDQHS